MARKENFPPAFSDALRSARDRGELVLTFDTEEVCTRERLRFYRFLASIRADRGHELCAVAEGCVVQWRAMYGSKSRRVLRIVANGKASDEVWSRAASGVSDDDAARDLAISDVLARERIEAEKKFSK